MNSVRISPIPLPDSPPAEDPTPGGRMPWRSAGIGLTSLATPIGIGVADPILASIAIVIELAVALTIVCTALFGSQALSERAFRLLRWIANRPEPPAPKASDSCPDANCVHGPHATRPRSAQTTLNISAGDFGK